VADRDRPQGGTIGSVKQIGPGFLVRDTAAASLQSATPGNQRGRQHITDETVCDQASKILDLRSEKDSNL
jgi:hypothetical protein